MKIRTILILILAAAVATASCGTRKTKLERQNLIPEKDLVLILKDLYITDGLIGFPKVMMKYAPIDSATTYYNVIEKHGYSKEAMDRTMKYYFIKNPKRLIKIYDKVLGILSEQESRVQKEIARTRPKATTLWPGPDYYSFPDPTGNDSTRFKIKADKQGYYVLSATITLYPDDNSYKPVMIAMSCNADSLETGKRKYAKSFDFIKDGRPHKYKISFNVPAKTKLVIEGDLCENQNMPDLWQRHMLIQNVSLIHSTIDQ